MVWILLVRKLSRLVFSQRGLRGVPIWRWFEKSPPIGSAHAANGIHREP